MKTTETPPCVCPHCKHVLDAASGETQPEDGDMTICIYCSGIGVFYEGLRVRVPTDGELREIVRHPQLRQWLDGVAEVREIIHGPSGAG